MIFFETVTKILPTHLGKPGKRWDVFKVWCCVFLLYGGVKVPVVWCSVVLGHSVMLSIFFGRNLVLCTILERNVVLCIFFSDVTWCYALFWGVAWSCVFFFGRHVVSYIILGRSVVLCIFSRT